MGKKNTLKAGNTDQKTKSSNRRIVAKPSIPKEKTLMESKNEMAIDPMGGIGAFLFQNKLRTLPDTVDMKPLKKFANEKLLQDLLFKTVILLEPDELPLNLYLSRLPLYFRLIEFGCER